MSGREKTYEGEVNWMSIDIPEHFCRAPFYDSGDHVLKPDETNQFEHGTLPLFWFDLVERQDAQHWDKHELLPKLFKRWHELDEILSVYHEQENKQEVARFTPEFTALVIEAFFWINDKRVPTLVGVEDEISKLAYIPPNSKDRLAFVLIAPHRYRCYIQMRSLMEELEKLNARLRVMEARSK